MQIAVSENDVLPATVRVDVSGDVDARTAPALDAILRRALDKRPPRVRLDLGAVDVVSAAGMTVLLQARHRSAALGVHLEVVDPPARMRRLVTSLGLVDALGLPPA